MGGGKGEISKRRVVGRVGEGSGVGLRVIRDDTDGGGLWGGGSVRIIGSCMKPDDLLTSCYYNLSS